MIGQILKGADEMVFGGKRRADQQQTQAFDQNIKLNDMKGRMAALGTAMDMARQFTDPNQQRQAFTQTLSQTGYADMAQSYDQIMAGGLGQDASLQTSRARTIRDLSSAISNIRDSYSTPEIEKGALEKDSTYRSLTMELGRILAGQGQGQGQGQESTQEQPGQLGQPGGTLQPHRRMADLFMANPMPQGKPETEREWLERTWGTPSFKSAQEGPAATSVPVTPVPVSTQKTYKEAPVVSQGNATPSTISPGAIDDEQMKWLEEQGHVYSQVAESFVDGQEKRSAAIQQGKPVVDNGLDGVDTTPKTFQQLGMDEAQAREFSELEKMTEKSLPEETNLRQLYQQYPKSFALLLQAIREGVPDGKGGKRKLSMSEIIKAVNSMGY